MRYDDLEKIDQKYFVQGERFYKIKSFGWIVTISNKIETRQLKKKIIETKIKIAKLTCAAKNDQ